MGELAARELADDLAEIWHDVDSEVSLQVFMRLSGPEYAEWVTRNVLPDDFERRHA